MKLPTLQEALKDREEIKGLLEVVRSDLDYMREKTRINATSEQRRFRNFLELSFKNLVNELRCSDFTIAEIEWYGEGAER